MLAGLDRTRARFASQHALQLLRCTEMLQCTAMECKIGWCYLDWRYLALYHELVHYYGFNETITERRVA